MLQNLCWQSKEKQKKTVTILFNKVSIYFEFVTESTLVFKEMCFIEDAWKNSTESFIFENNEYWEVTGWKHNL